MIIEAQKRKSMFDLTSSVPVKFSDGQTWYLPRPALKLRPIFKDRKVIDTKTVCADPELLPLRDAVAGATDDMAIFNAMVDLALHLLKQNYELADDELDDLFTFELGQADNAESWISGVMDVAHGRTK